MKVWYQMDDTNRQIEILGNSHNFYKYDNN